MDDLGKFFLATITSAGVSTILLLAAGWLFRTAIGERLKSSVKHVYDDRLEKLKAELRDQGNSNLALMNSELDRQAEKLRVAASSFSEVQKVTISRKIDAVDVLWAGFTEMQSAFPSQIFLTDIFSDQEMKGFYSPSMTRFSKGIAALQEADFINAGFAQVQAVRPHLGEYTWAIYETYRTVMGRSMYLIKEGKSDASKIEWYLDQNIKNLVVSAFGQDGLNEFVGLGHGRYRWLNYHFSKALLAAIDTVLTGRSFSVAALEQAQRMEEQIIASPQTSEIPNS